MAIVDSIAARSRRASGDDQDSSTSVNLMALRDKILPKVTLAMPADSYIAKPRGEKAALVMSIVEEFKQEFSVELNPLQERNLVTALIEARIASAKLEEEQRLIKQYDLDPVEATPQDKPSGRSEVTEPEVQQQKTESRNDAFSATGANNERVREAVEKVRPVLLNNMDVSAAARLSRQELAEEINKLVGDALRDTKIQLNSLETRNMVTILVNDMLGLGPLESLLADDAITDIMVNGPKQVYIERGGKLVLSDVNFRDNAHVMAIATRIVSNVGRRVDESSPLCDARLDDGSRVNIIIPPLAIDGPSISIRKFSEKKITLEMMAQTHTISTPMMRVLQIASRCRMNVLISGGTGSGKTTTLNAMSRMIDIGERVVTIEDAAELQLQQPHVVRLETRPPSLEGKGEITMRDLVKNALRMRPDRIILGEVRGSEALDMLQAMNTGHEGSMGTIHANNPREALTRLENMIAMGGFNLPPKAMRQQIASAVDIILQVSRMRDGKRRITSVSEVVGMEGDIITMQELFAYRFEGEDADGNLIGNFEPSGLRPNFAEKARYFGLDKPLLEAMKE
ncbi:CpaF family protein [Kiloniella sp. b19]|uniref:CpaF family protein n=1 Tax=Kiloniella sp. GXU_MW_B19 TaxID=3141326 RepID=UPI0031DFFB31